MALNIDFKTIKNGKYIILCDHKAKFDEITKLLYISGYTYCNGETYNNPHKYDRYKELTCLCPSEGTYGSYTEEGYLYRKDEYITIMFEDVDLYSIFKK